MRWCGRDAGGRCSRRMFAPTSHHAANTRAPTGSRQDCSNTCFLQSSLVAHLRRLHHRPAAPGNSVILSIIDRFSKMAHFIPLPKLSTAKERVQLLVQHVFRLYGPPPRNVVSDQGPQFASNFWREFCGLMEATASLFSGSGPHIQRPGREAEPGPGGRPAPYGCPKSVLLAALGAVGGVHSQLAFKFCPRDVSV